MFASGTCHSCVTFDYTCETIQVQNKVSTASKKCTFSSWKYSHYFEFISVKGKNIIVSCALCGGNKSLSTSKNATSNLLKHLKGQRSAVKLVEKISGAVKTTVEPSANKCPTPAMQQRLDFSHQTPISGEGLNRLVTGYI